MNSSTTSKHTLRRRSVTHSAELSHASMQRCCHLCAFHRSTSTAGPALDNPVSPGSPIRQPLCPLTAMPGSWGHSIRVPDGKEPRPDGAGPPEKEKCGFIIKMPVLSLPSSGTPLPCNLQRCELPLRCILWLGLCGPLSCAGRLDRDELDLRGS